MGFYAINHLPHPLWADIFFRWIHLLTRSGIIYYPLLIGLFFSGKKKLRQFAVYAACCLVITGALSDGILKHAVHRLRPYQTLPGVHVVLPLPTSYSFPSGQAAGVSALTAAFFLYFPSSKWNWVFLGFALLVYFDRVYMGHHYPSDVIGGAAIGSLVSWAIYCFAGALRR